MRKLLIENGITGKSCTRVSAYLPWAVSGIGLKSIRHETELQYVRKRVYLQNHPEMTETRERYEKSARKGWRNSITDAKSILENYEVEPPERSRAQPVNTYARRTVKLVQQKQIDFLMQEWTAAIHYGRIMEKEQEIISFPALSDIRLEDWVFMRTRQAAKEQIAKLGAIPESCKTCTRGCNANETAYHVISSCVAQWAIFAKTWT